MRRGLYALCAPLPCSCSLHPAAAPAAPICPCACELRTSPAQHAAAEGRQVRVLPGGGGGGKDISAYLGMQAPARGGQRSSTAEPKHAPPTCAAGTTLMERVQRQKR